MRFKLGKTAARPNSVKLMFSQYVNLAALPKPPANFGHTNLIRNPWGILGNADYGDCYWAGSAHETMLWNAEGKTPVTFTTDSVLSDYSAATGFNKSVPASDAGTDMQKGAAYRQTDGVLDGSGKRHKIGAYLGLEAGNLQEHLIACFLFSAVGVGLTLPESAQEQFQDGHPWDVVPGSPIEGGHYTPMMGRRCDQSLLSTWGSFAPATDAFFEANNDESIVYLSPEMLVNGASIDGFKSAALLDDLNQLGHPISL